MRRAGSRRAAENGASVGLPFLAPLLVLGAAGVIAFVARRWGFPIRGPGGILGPLDDNLNETYTRISNEDYSAFGPLGIVALLAASLLTVVAYIRRRADSRRLALACALPVFLVLLALGTSWNPFLIRFFLVPGVLAAPLLAHLFRGPATALAYFAVAGIVAGLTITSDQPKPLSNPYGFGPPWSLTVPYALATNSRDDFAAAVTAYDATIPPHACVGAALDVSDPAYYLFGQRLQHRVVFLPLGNPVPAALANGLFYVVINAESYNSLAGQFAAAGWRITPLGPAWLLASEPNAGAGLCR